MKKIIWVFILLLSGVMGRAQSVKGRVVDAATQGGLGGVVIRVGEKQFVSNDKGEFVMDLDKGQYQLKVSAIGYDIYMQDFTVPSTAFMSIALTPKTEQLETVTVSTGYQSLPKERATGSFSVVNAQRLATQVGPNILDRLEGITPALTVDRRSNGGSLMIRGLSTLRSNRLPLIVVDNFPYEGDLTNLNPADVASVTILKDAAAASIWGARAGNGVIVITTKKGSFNSKTTLQGGVGFNFLGIPDAAYSRRISAKDLIGVEQLLFSKGYYTSQEQAVGHPALSPAVELMIAARDGKLTAQGLQAELALLETQNIDENYGKAFYHQGLNKQYYLNAMGGSSAMNWKVFAGLDDNKSVLDAGYRRYNLKFEQRWQLLKGLDLGLSLTYSGTNTKSGKTALSSFTTASGALPSYTQFMDGQGNALAVMRDYRSDYTKGAGGGKLLNWDYYPMEEQGNTVNRTSDLLGNFTASYPIYGGLKASVYYQYELQNLNGRSDYSQESYYTRNLINLYSQVNGGSVTRAIPLGGIVDFERERLEVNQLRGQVNFDRTLGDFQLNVLAGAERRIAKVSGESNRQYGFDPQTLSSASVDYANAYPNLVYGSGSFIPDLSSFKGTDTRFASLYANAAVSYHNRYTLSGSARRDGSNLFGVATNNKWSPLWSAGFAWLLSAEEFAKFLPYTRLRLSYGSSGNASTAFAAVTTISYGPNSPYTQSPVAGFSNYANPDLRWETVKTLNLGADFKFFGDRISASVDYYVKRAVDLIGLAPIDYTTGVGYSITKNAAKISGRGLDLELTSRNLNGALQWKTDLFLNSYRDRVDAYYLESAMASNFIAGDANVNGIEGMPVYAVYGYRWAGLNPINGNPRGYVAGQISEDYNSITGSTATIGDLDYIGRAFPTLTGALGNDFEWHGFNLDFRIGFKLGYYFRRPSLSYSSLYASRTGDVEYAQRWQKAGDELQTDVPSAIYPASGVRDAFYNYSTATVISGDHIRLQTIGFGYMFSKQKFKVLPFDRLALHVRANNLGLLWKANSVGLDPDYPLVKPFKTFTLSAKINF